MFCHVIALLPHRIRKSFFFLHSTTRQLLLPLDDSVFLLFVLAFHVCFYTMMDVLFKAAIPGILNRKVVICLEFSPNSSFMYFICGLVILFVVAQSVFFLLRAECLDMYNLAYKVNS